MQRKWKYWWTAIGLLFSGCIIFFIGINIQTTHSVLNPCYAAHTCTIGDPMYVERPDVLSTFIALLLIPVGVISWIISLYPITLAIREQFRDNVLAVVNDEW